MDQRHAQGASRLEPQHALELLGPVIQAIAAAHREGVVHRDLKPSNIILVEQHDAVVAKVLDFGIAQIRAGEKPQSAETALSSDSTRGFAGFSPDYAAPEQVSYGRTGPWTDVHALGLILTELVTGERPYPSGGDIEQRLSAVVAERRPTPASKGVDVDRWEPVLARALARRPVDRHPDAHSLFDALSAALAVPPTAGRRRSGGRGRSLLAAGLGLALAAGAGWAWLARRPLPEAVPPPARVMMAVLPFENLTGDPQQEYFSDGLTDGIISQIGRVAPERLAVIARTSVSRYKGGVKSVKEIGRELGVVYLLESSVKRGGNRVRVDARLIKVADETQVWGDSYDREVKDVLALQSDIARAIAGGIRLKLNPDEPANRAKARTLNPAAYDAYLRGRFLWEKKDAADYPKALKYFEQAIRLDPGYAAAYAGLADVYAMMGLNGNSRAPEVADKAKQAALRALALDDRLSDAHSTLAHVLVMYHLDWKGGAEHFRRALELDPNNAEAHRQLRSIYLASAGPIGRIDPRAPASAGARPAIANRSMRSWVGSIIWPGATTTPSPTTAEPAKCTRASETACWPGRTCTRACTRRPSKSPSNCDCLDVAAMVHARAGRPAEAQAYPRAARAFRGRLHSRGAQTRSRLRRPGASRSGVRRAGKGLPAARLLRAHLVARGSRHGSATWRSPSGRPDSPGRHTGGRHGPARSLNLVLQLDPVTEPDGDAVPNQ